MRGLGLERPGGESVEQQNLLIETLSLLVQR
jgi:hypothetical protein